MNVGQPVKFREPANESEAAARFVLIEINGDRGLIRLLCDLPIPPIELVRMDMIVPAHHDPAVARGSPARLGGVRRRNGSKSQDQRDTATGPR